MWHIRGDQNCLIKGLLQSDGQYLLKFKHYQQRNLHHVKGSVPKNKGGFNTVLYCESSKGPGWVVSSVCNCVLLPDRLGLWGGLVLGSPP